MSTEKDKNIRPLAYPKPTETDQQLKNQPEFVDQQPNKSDDEELDGKPALKDYQEKNQENRKQ